LGGATIQAFAQDAMKRVALLLAYLLLLGLSIVSLAGATWALR
jgi:hypothetical protein